MTDIPLDDLSNQDVIVVPLVIFAGLIVELSAESSHNWSPLTSEGWNVRSIGRTEVYG